MSEATEDRVRIWYDPPAVQFPGKPPWEADEVTDFYDWIPDDHGNPRIVRIRRFSAVRDGKGWCCDVLHRALPDEDGGYVKRPEEQRPRTWRDREPMF